MIDIGKYKHNIKCPKCNFRNTILLKQVKIKDVIICRGCKRNIQLIDHMNSYIMAERQLKQSIKEIQDSLNGLTNITI